jgi:thioesterase domain-containing protein
LHATELLIDIEAAFGRPLPATIFLTGATVRDMAEALRGSATGRGGASVFPVQVGGSKPPLFCLVRSGGVISVRHIADAVGPEQPVYALWYPAMHGPADTAGSLEEIAAECVTAIREVQPAGPRFLFGHSLGAIVVYEIARQLAAVGDEIGLVVMADGPHPSVADRERRKRQEKFTVRYRARKLASRRGPEIVAARVRGLLGRNASVAPPAPVAMIPGTDIPEDHTAALARELAYVPGPAAGPIVILASQQYLERAGGPDLGWGALLTPGWESYEVPGDHNSMIAEPHVHALATQLAQCLERASAEERGSGVVGREEALDGELGDRHVQR